MTKTSDQEVIQADREARRVSAKDALDRAMRRYPRTMMHLTIADMKKRPSPPETPND